MHWSWLILRETEKLREKPLQTAFFFHCSLCNPVPSESSCALCLLLSLAFIRFNATYLRVPLCFSFCFDTIIRTEENFNIL